MKRTRLYERHVGLGGRMVPFAGYELPVQYTAGPNAEHRSVRTAGGVFDIDHMGQFALSGEDALPFLQYVQVADVAQLAEWEAHYSLLCYEDGTLVDDIFIYRLPRQWLIVVNAANREKDFTWLQSFTHGFQVELTDISDETYMLAVQGPKAVAILDRMTAADLAAVPGRSSLRTQVGGVEMLLGRTGYTGEDGFELYLPPEKVVPFWDALLAEGAGDGLLPCGLAARDSLRFEACIPDHCTGRQGGRACYHRHEKPDAGQIRRPGLRAAGNAPPRFGHSHSRPGQAAQGADLQAAVL